MFEFSSSLFFWTLINFLILLFLVHKLALPSFLKMVEESEARKEAALLEIEKNHRESQQILEEYKSKLSQVQNEAKEILALANKEREQLMKSEKEKMLEEKNVLLSGIRNELDVEKKRFLSDLKVESVNLILATAKKLIGRELNQSEHEQLIAEDIEALDAMIKR